MPCTSAHPHSRSLPGASAPPYSPLFLFPTSRALLGTLSCTLPQVIVEHYSSLSCQTSRAKCMCTTVECAFPILVVVVSMSRANLIRRCGAHEACYVLCLRMYAQGVLRSNRVIFSAVQSSDLEAYHLEYLVCVYLRYVCVTLHNCSPCSCSSAQLPDHYGGGLRGRSQTLGVQLCFSAILGRGALPKSASRPPTDAPYARPSGERRPLPRAFGVQTSLGTAAV